MTPETYDRTMKAFNTIIESMRERAYGKDPYIVGKANQLKDMVDCCDLHLETAWAISLPRLIREFEQRMNIKTADYSLFNGGI